MRRYDGRQSFITFAQRVAREHGHDISRDDADMVLWEFTGFPAFWDGDPMECLDRQLTDVFTDPPTEEE